MDRTALGLDCLKTAGHVPNFKARFSREIGGLDQLIGFECAMIIHIIMTLNKLFQGASFNLCEVPNAQSPQYSP